MNAEAGGKVLSRLDGGVLTVTLADPGNRNALSRALTSELVAAMTRAEEDDEVRVVVLTNEGRVFCAGADLSERSDEAERGETFAPGEIFTRIRNATKPWVARIAGHAVAGGMGLVAACDISVAVEDVKMGFTEVRVGVAPAMISVLCLARMTRGDAAEAFLRGSRFPASEGARMGLVNHAVPAADLDATVDAIVSDLLLGAPGALAAAKLLINRVPTMDFDAAMAWTAELSAALFEGPEAAEGMAAYLGKRKPAWADPDSGGRP